jgi:hypothetical protein
MVMWGGASVATWPCCCAMLLVLLGGPVVTRRYWCYCVALLLRGIVGAAGCSLRGPVAARRCWCCGAALLLRGAATAVRRCYCCVALFLRGATTEFLSFNFFLSIRQLQEKKWEREREKGVRFETCFPALLVSITPAPSCNNTNSLRQHQHTHPPATIVATIVATTTITQELTSKRNLWLSTWSRESGVFLELN